MLETGPSEAVVCAHANEAIEPIKFLSARLEHRAHPRIDTCMGWGASPLPSTLIASGGAARSPVYVMTIKTSAAVRRRSRNVDRSSGRPHVTNRREREAAARYAQADWLTENRQAI
jgi:hypothetical protein